MEWLNSLGPTAGAVVVVILFLRYIQSKDKSDDDRNKQNTAALNENTKAMKSVAIATTKQAREAEKRNGHLAEIATANNEINIKNQKAILDAIANLPIQHIKTQLVDKQTVNRETIKKQVKE